ncbi:Protein disulfide-isomerase [Monocercomonoides exilis]|uniref:Protein disulfide-isomerase n=1 Tax=Monocercomonoides exilis TaxID=2049356 RepID=UPI003559459C|nr:Protein disulfide-isomerase [Monocercomonoides exilis]|eukprot:MONOS_6841.1-p1 / transcript=MONOS_6841.1 / gene=MONOS_6841 / organism=Monocercomonoides_exilis_PA203 / gene_product=Protein disulfide-isomerase / transcript_product=Protein disulfide-isomerase / location=Mono_scaffold00223:57186-58028(+) / protein_length=166 / sequence_SO=supercontig / SO=protein_coding / is_pseudo=false
MVPFSERQKRTLRLTMLTVAFSVGFTAFWIFGNVNREFDVGENKLDNSKKIENKPQKSYLTIFDDASLQKSLESEIPTLVLYHSPMCGQCKQFFPFYEHFAFVNRDNGKFKIGAIDCDELYDVCLQMQIDMNPSLVLYQRKVAHKINIDKPDSILSLVNKVLQNK